MTTHPDEMEALARRAAQALRELPDAPEAWQAAAFALMPQAQSPQAAAAAAGRPAPSLGERLGERLGALLEPVLQPVLQPLLALLSFDSWAQPATASGMRGLRDPVRQLLYSAQGRDIDLRLTPGAESWSIAGQVLGPDERGSLRLWALPEGSGDALAAEATLDEFGEFRVEGLRPGEYRLSFALGAQRVDLPPLRLGEPPV